MFTRECEDSRSQFLDNEPRTLERRDNLGDALVVLEENNQIRSENWRVALLLLQQLIFLGAFRGACKSPQHTYNAADGLHSLHQRLAHSLSDQA